MSFGGGSSKEQERPEPVDQSAVARDAIQSEIDLGPQLAESRQQISEEMSPRQAQQMLDLQRDFGPQLGQAQQDFRQSLDPARFESDQFAIGDARQRAEMGLSQDELDFFDRQFSAEEAGAGRLGGQVGSLNVSRALLGQQMQAKSQGRSEIQALNQGFAIQPQSGLGRAQADTQSQYLSPFMNSANQNFGTSAGMFNAQGQQQTARRGQNLQLLGSAAGAGGVMGAGFFGG